MSDFNTLCLQVNGYVIREEERDGRKYLVVPCVMIREGVHNGSAGPLFHPISELGRYPGSWDGIPVVIHHPHAEDGTPISANSPALMERVVGRVYNTHVEDDKLKAEVYVDRAALERISPVTLAYLLQQRPLDVSVGIFNDDDPTPGDWNGEHYEAIAKNPRPDHLALLPGGTGACSWADGCGIRANEEEEGGKVFDATKQTWLLIMEEGFVPSVMSTDYRDIVRKIQMKLDGMDTESQTHYGEAVYDESFIYSVRSRDGSSVGEKLYERAYSVAENGDIQFGEVLGEVYRKTEYPRVAANEASEGGRRKIQRIQNNEGGNTMKEKVDELLGIAPGVYSEDDRQWLDALEEGQITKMIACAKSKVKEVKVEVPAVNNEADAVKVLEGKLSNFDTFKGLLPAEIRGQLEHGQRLYEQHRADLVAHVIANQAGDGWKQEDLTALSTDVLEKLANSIKPVVEYLGQGGGDRQLNDNSEQVMLPMGVEASA